MEFISISKKHSFFSSFAHVLLNILLVVACWFSIFITKVPFIAIGLILISKWRTFAVRPRYWLVNFKSNLVDLIFSLGVVILMYSTGVEFWASQIFLILTFILWLLIIKPRTGDNWMKAQSLMSVFFGLTAGFSIFYSLPTEIILIFAFVIGYSSIRHQLSEIRNFELISLFWGMFFAELVWLLNFLLIGYTLSFSNVFLMVIPQASIIATVISFLAFEVIHNSKNEDKETKELIAPTLFTIGICLILLIMFSTVPHN